MSKKSAANSKANKKVQPAPPQPPSDVAAAGKADVEAATSAMAAATLDASKLSVEQHHNGNNGEQALVKKNDTDNVRDTAAAVAENCGESLKAELPEKTKVENHAVAPTVNVAGDGDAAKPTANGVGNAGHRCNSALKALLERTGLESFITVGQRRIGPAANGEQAASDPTGREVFVGHLPRDMYEDSLYELFSDVGEIRDVRVMVDPGTGCSRGFGFVCYVDKASAEAAVEKFNGYEAATNRHLQVNITTPNLRLFVGNVPKTKTREQLLTDFQNHLDGVVDVIVTAPGFTYGQPQNTDSKRRNRGFCFVEFSKHSAASAARRRLQRQPRVWPTEQDVWVDWADPIEEPDSVAMESVRAVYIRGVSPSLTEDQLSEAFQQRVAKPYRIRLVPGDYAFVHFSKREDALKAAESMNGLELAGSQLSVSMARPLSDRARQKRDERRIARFQHTQMAHMQHPPLPSFHHHQHNQHQHQQYVSAQAPQPLPAPPPPQHQQQSHQQQQQVAVHNPNAAAAAAAMAAQYAAAAAAAAPIMAMPHAPPAAWYTPTDYHQQQQALQQQQAAFYAPAPAVQYYTHSPYALQPMVVPMPPPAQPHQTATPQPVGYPQQQLQPQPQQTQQQRNNRARQPQYFAPQPQQQQFAAVPNYPIAGGAGRGAGYLPSGVAQQRGAHTYLSASSHPN